MKFFSRLFMFWLLTLAVGMEPALAVDKLGTGKPSADKPSADESGATLGGEATSLGVALKKETADPNPNELHAQNLNGSDDELNRKLDSISNDIRDLKKTLADSHGFAALISTFTTSAILLYFFGRSLWKKSGKPSTSSLSQELHEMNSRITSALAVIVSDLRTLAQVRETNNHVGTIQQTVVSPREHMVPGAPTEVSAAPHGVSIPSVQNSSDTWPPSPETPSILEPRPSPSSLAGESSSQSDRVDDFDRVQIGNMFVSALRQNYFKFSQCWDALKALIQHHHPHDEIVWYDLQATNKELAPQKEGMGAAVLCRVLVVGTDSYSGRRVGLLFISHIAATLTRSEDFLFLCDVNSGIAGIDLSPDRLISYLPPIVICPHGQRWRLSTAKDAEVRGLIEYR